MSIGVIGNIAVKLMRFKEDMASKVHNVMAPSFEASVTLPWAADFRDRSLPSLNLPLFALLRLSTFGRQLKFSLWMERGRPGEGEAEARGLQAQACIRASSQAWRPHHGPPFWLYVDVILKPTSRSEIYQSLLRSNKRGKLNSISKTSCALRHAAQHAKRNCMGHVRCFAAAAGKK